MHPNERLITDFYEAFAAKDHTTMEAAYHSEATFSDPVFPALNAAEVRAMWRMFCTGGGDLVVRFEDVRADDANGSARWDARYAFPRTGRPVHNQIAASFVFRDGKIYRHLDSFDFYRWTRMALGPVGWALGWTPIVRSQVRAQARAQLDRFMAGEPGA